MENKVVDELDEVAVPLFSGADSLAGGKVLVHSVKPLMLFTPSRLRRI